MKYATEQIFDELTNTYILIDERIFHDCVFKTIDDCQRNCKERILKVAPEHKQKQMLHWVFFQTKETNQIKNKYTKYLDLFLILWNNKFWK
jgi:hypothetical protein